MTTTSGPQGRPVAGEDPPEAEATDAQLLDGSYEGPVRIRGPLRTLLLWMVPAFMAFWITGGAITSILLGLQVYDLDPARKVQNLAVMTTITGVLSLAAQPLAGMMSDRTRSRFGRRTPWIVGGTLVGLIGVSIMGTQHTLAGITACWVIAQLGYNASTPAISAIMPDRVPRLARGTFSAFTGLGAIVAGLLGNLLGSAFRNAIPIGYVVVGSIVFVTMTVFCVANPDPPSTDLPPTEPLSPARLLRGFWVNPVAHPDFGWVFAGRFLLYLGFNMVQTYSLYLLADYIGLGRDGAATFVPWITVASTPLGLIGLLVSGPLSDRLGRRKIFVLASTACIAIAMVVPWIWPTTQSMLVMAAVMGLGFGVFQSVDTALVSEVLPSSADYGKDFGVINLAGSIPGLLVPGLAAVVIGVGGYAMLFPVGIVLAGLASLAVLPIRSVR